jgi:transposase
MQNAADRPETAIAIHTDLVAIFVSLELSRSTWLVTSLSPGGGDRMSRHAVPGGDLAALLARLAHLQDKAQARTGRRFPVVAIQEAGLDGCNYSTPPHSNKLLRENGFLAYRIRPEWEATKCAIGS